jgi:hypothetical protein
MKSLPAVVTALLISLLVAAPTRAWAKKTYQPIEVIASQADYIVVGVFLAVQAHTYQFKVAEYVKGSGLSSLTVQQFEEWTCDIRYAKPAKGQRLVLFLKKHDAALELINGSTGEMPILNNQVTLPNEAYSPQLGRPFVPYTIDLAEFKTGMKRYIRCFKIPVDPNASAYFHTRAIVQLGTAQEIAAFRSASKFTGWLYERIKTYYTVAKQ